MLRPSLVIFDMDDVLCHYQLGKRLRYLADIANTTARDVRAALWDSGFEELADAGGYTDADIYLAEFAKRLGFDLTKQQWLEARRLAMTPYSEVLDIAKAVKRDATIAIFTNNGPLVKDNIDYLLPEAAALFALRFCSYEFGTKKPDPESFTRLVKALNKKPDDCWFIDDKRSNVQGAVMAGLRGHHFRHAEDLAEEARELGFTL
jgi:HAD superfamily hydrolase (TIGR01509 family)